MKRILPALLLMLSFSTGVLAQMSNLVIFTENGERFQLVLNGVIQNVNPATNVKLTDLNAPNYKMKILFEDKSLGEISKNLFLEANAENTFNIKRKNSGEWVVRVLSITPLAQLPPSPPPTPNQSVVVYHATPLPAQTVTTTTTTTTVDDPMMNDNINLNIGINGLGMNMNMSGTGTGTTTSQTTTTYTTTTTVNSTPPPPPPPPTHTTVVVHNPPPTDVYVMPGYSGPTGCPAPMSPQDFAGIKSSISSKSFENTKLDMAKSILGNRCMTAAQVKEMMSVFSFENSKLDFAKFAYGRTYDLGNYYMVNDAFDFESSISDLNNYINGR